MVLETCAALSIRMRLYQFGEGGKLVEFNAVSYEERSLHSWLEHNPHVLAVEVPLLIIGREVATEAGNIDLLAVNTRGDLLILELKHGHSPREAIAQALDYLEAVESWDVERLESVAGDYFRRTGSDWKSIEEAVRHLATEYGDTEDEASGDQPITLGEREIAIVAEDIPLRLWRMAYMLNRKGFSVRCFESCTYTQQGMWLASVTAVVGPEDVQPPRPGERRGWSEDAFFEELEQQLAEDSTALAAAHALYDCAAIRARENPRRLVWGTDAYTGSFVLRCMLGGGIPCSLWGLDTKGALGIFYGRIIEKLGQQALDRYVYVLQQAVPEEFAELPERIRRRETAFGYLRRPSSSPVFSLAVPSDEGQGTRLPGGNGSRDRRLRGGRFSLLIGGGTLTATMGRGSCQCLQ